MLRLSSLGSASILAMPSICSAMRSRIRFPCSGWYTSRPRNMIVILTLCPSPRNLATWRVLVSKSPGPIFGRYFISLIPTWTVLRRLSLARWASSNLNLPKSMIRHTGGLAMGATSTRSRSSSLAIARASGSGLIPSWTPSGSTSRTSRARIRSLIRCSVVVSATMRHHTSHSGPRSFREPIGGRGADGRAEPAPEGRSTWRTMLPAVQGGGQVEAAQ